MTPPDVASHGSDRDPRDDPLDDVGEVIRRVVAARVRDPDAIDDLVQESLARVLEARPRLDAEALAPYGIVVARNLVSSRARSEDRRRRHRHRLIDLRDPERPEDRALREEDARAVSAALRRLSQRDRDAVVAHELGGTDTATLARELDSTPGGVAVRLARARAKLRVEYLLALRRDEPPTEICRSVLIALSAGDRRRQTALGAGDHLLDCAHCSAVSEPLLRRRRTAEGLVAAVGLDRVGAWLARSARSTQVQAGAATVAVSTTVVVALGAPSEEPPPFRRPLPAAITTLAGEPVRLRAGLGLDRLAGREVRARDVLVQSVPADEGFWVGPSERNRLWVRLTPGSESRRTIEAGRRVSFRGTLVAHRARFPTRAGVTQAEGAAQLRRQGLHVKVAGADLRLR